MTFDNKIISVIVPIRDEEIIIEKFLLSMKEQLVPSEMSLEIILVDGMSNDKTIDNINKFINKNPNFKIKIFKNNQIYTPFAMNIGLKESRGRYICIFGCHTIYPKDYIHNCYDELNKMDADCAGGWHINEINNNSFGGKVVASIQTHKFGVGNSYKTNYNDGWVDTAAYSMYDKKIFDKVGLFNTKLIRGQDYEMNKRIIKNGGKIWFSTKIKSHYYGKQNFIQFLKKQLYEEGPFNVYMWNEAPYALGYRHGITLFFSLGFIIGIILISFFTFPILNGIYFSVMLLYSFLALTSGIQKGLEYKNFILAILLPICFFLFHFVHGIGMLRGVFNVILKRGYK